MKKLILAAAMLAVSSVALAQENHQRDDRMHPQPNHYDQRNYGHGHGHGHRHHNGCGHQLYYGGYGYYGSQPYVPYTARPMYMHPTWCAIYGCVAQAVPVVPAVPVMPVYPGQYYGGSSNSATISIGGANNDTVYGITFGKNW